MHSSAYGIISGVRCGALYVGVDESEEKVEGQRDMVVGVNVRGCL